MSGKDLPLLVLSRCLAMVADVFDVYQYAWLIEVSWALNLATLSLVTFEVPQKPFLYSQGVHLLGKAICDI